MSEWITLADALASGRLDGFAAQAEAEVSAPPVALNLRNW